MGKDTIVQLQQPEYEKDPLSTMLREGAQQLIAGALQAEVEEFLSRFAGKRDEFGRAAVVRNGFHPQRSADGPGAGRCSGAEGQVAYRRSGGVSLLAGAAVREAGKVAGCSSAVAVPAWDIDRRHA